MKQNGARCKWIQQMFAAISAWIEQATSIIVSEPWRRSAAPQQTQRRKHLL
jgi:hypothetical protein